MSTIAVKVVKAGLKIDDEILASLMLAGLPDEFRPLVMAVENSSIKLTSESVKTLLLQETRLMSNSNNSRNLEENQWANLSFDVTSATRLVTWVRIVQKENGIVKKGRKIVMKVLAIIVRTQRSEVNAGERVL